VRVPARAAAPGALPLPPAAHGAHSGVLLVGLGTAAGLAAGLQQARSGPRRRLPHVGRRFFNFGGQEQEQDPDDPGRAAMCKEYQNMPGQFVSAEESEFGWAVVSSHSASEQDGYWPSGDAPGEVSQEWRELRLAKPKEGGGTPGVSEGTGQSVVKVSLCGDAAPVQVPYCAALGYTKSACALALTGAHVQGALPLEADQMRPLRALVVGLGAGSIPLWLKHTFPEGRMVVDALEIDPAVVKVATGAMGFPAAAVRPAADAGAAAADALDGAGGEAMRVFVVGGEAFIEALAAKEPEDYKYDMVFIDAFDKGGKVPPVLVDPEGPFLKSLPALLAPTATLSINLLVGLTGSGSSGGPKEIEAMITAIHKTCCVAGSETFTVRTPMNESSGNVLYGFLRGGRPGEREGSLKEALQESAKAVNEGFPADSLGTKLRFEFARRLSFAYKDWSPDGAAAGGGERRSGGSFGFF